MSGGSAPHLDLNAAGLRTCALVDKPEAVSPPAEKEVPHLRGDGLDGQAEPCQVDPQEVIGVPFFHRRRLIGKLG